MSEVKHYKGTAVRVAVGAKEIEAFAKNILQEHGRTEVPSYCDSWTEYLEDYFYNRFARINNALYDTVYKVEVGDEEDVYNAVRVRDGYKFELKYYDGGESFDGALQRAINNAERKQ